jgi:4-hydroxy-tetrahydrodipicolinate synthase
MTDAVADRFEGAHCPLVTPFEDGEVNHDALAGLVDHVLGGGVDGLVPCGTSGEFASLDDAEYRDVVETTVEAADGAPVMAGAGETSVPETLARIETAADVGADATLITLPYFHGANDPAGDTAFLQRVADEAALPIYLYNIPTCVGRPIDTETVLALADHERVLGMKDSSGDFNYFSELLRRTPEAFQLFQGFDSHLVPGLVFGADGGINALSNVIPEAFATATESVGSGDTASARRIHEERIAPLFQECLDYGFAPATKTALRARGVLDDDAVRPPLVALDDDTRSDFASLVERVAVE